MSQAEPPRASPALKILHALVFFGFCALAIAAASPELTQLRFWWAGPFHAGTPPFWPALLGAAVSVGGAAALLLRLVQRREVSLFISGAVLAGFLTSLSVNLSHPEQRSIEAANVALLEVGRELQRVMGKKLQATAEVPATAEAWAEGLLEVQAHHPEFPAAVRDRAFRLQGFRTELVADGWAGQGAAPGTLGVWVSDDRAQFTLSPIGLSPRGEAELLRDDRGGPIRLRGVFNPDMHGE